MSDDIHPDLDLFYDALDTEDPEDEYLDDADDGDYTYTIGDDDDIYEDDDEDGDYVDDDDDDEEQDMDLDEDGTEIVIGDEDDDDEAEGDDAEDDDDGEGGVIDLEGMDAETVLNLAALLNIPGANPTARQSILSRLLSGPRSTSGSGRRLGQSIASAAASAGPRPRMTAEERARRLAERRRKERWWTPQKEPHPKGLELLRGGEFGRVGEWRAMDKKRRRPRGRPSFGMRYKRAWTSPTPGALVPNTHGTVVATYPSIPYVGQYAGEDYGLFYAATQAFTLHLYDTTKSRPMKHRRPNTGAGPGAAVQAGPASSPVNTTTTMSEEEDSDDDDDDDMGLGWGWNGVRRRSVIREDTSMKRIKQVRGVDGSWTVTDCDVDRNGQRMIYSSITPFVHMLGTAEDDTEHLQLDFRSLESRTGSRWGGYDRFGIWSIRFSADGKEVVAGATDGKILVYDIEAGQRTLCVTGHNDDVNAVSFADESSTNILVSGSDDGYVKVWDRRSLSSNTPSGILVGATEGITYTSPKGDGRYIVVNSKDQAARLYDLRKMRDPGEFRTQPDAVSAYGQRQFDYRSDRYPPPRITAHPKDCSIMTFRGHSVLRTLIRCHFSPRESTGQSYIYSGSADGMIHIWSLDGRVVQVLNRADSTPMRNSAGSYNDPSAAEIPRSTNRYGAMPYEMGQSWTVRDVSWHGLEPTLMSTCWEVDGGFRRGGTVAKHEWKGLGKNGLKRMEDWVEKAQAECGGA